MTPPDANLDKQKRRHRGPLIGMALVVIFGIGLITYWIFELFAEAPETEAEEPAVAIDPTETIEPGETGEAADPVEPNGVLDQ